MKESMAAPIGVAKNDREHQAQVYLQIGAPYYFWQCRQGTLYFSHKTTQRQTLKVFGAAFLQKGGSSSAEGKNTEPKAKTRLAGGVDAEVLAAVEGVAVAVEGVGREGKGWGLVGIFADFGVLRKWHHYFVNLTPNIPSFWTILQI